MGKFNERLKFLRQQKGISQHELASQLKLIMGDSKGCSKSSINMYERGEREPGIDTLEAIADYFNVDMNYLLGKADIPNQFALTNMGILSGQIVDLEHDKFSVPEIKIIKKYRSLDPHGKEVVDTVLDVEWRRIQAEEKARCEEQTLFVQSPPTAGGEDIPYAASDPTAKKSKARKAEKTQLTDDQADAVLEAVQSLDDPDPSA